MFTAYLHTISTTCTIHIKTRPTSAHIGLTRREAQCGDGRSTWWIWEHEACVHHAQALDSVDKLGRGAQKSLPTAHHVELL
ncbi:hypothetical protein CF336_g9202 [Tilletia laevis]|nr:hypothetical protein CF336_g9202 [Tilletia laevis]